MSSKKYETRRSLSREEVAKLKKGISIQIIRREKGQIKKNVHVKLNDFRYNNLGMISDVVGEEVEHVVDNWFNRIFRTKQLIKSKEYQAKRETFYNIQGRQMVYILKMLK